jgi:pyruvate dehydrogenase E1 component alpha subunit
VAVEAARSGAGPSLIELSTYRWREHVGPADDLALGYRTAEEMKMWMDRDPVRLFEERLSDEGVVDANAVADMRHAVEAEIEEAFDFAKRSPFPHEDELEQFVYPAEVAE